MSSLLWQLYTSRVSGRVLGVVSRSHEFIIWLRVTQRCVCRRLCRRSQRFLNKAARKGRSSPYGKRKTDSVSLRPSATAAGRKKASSSTSDVTSSSRGAKVVSNEAKVDLNNEPIEDVDTQSEGEAVGRSRLRKTKHSDLLEPIEFPEALVVVQGKNGRPLRCYDAQVLLSKTRQRIYDVLTTKIDDNDGARDPSDDLILRGLSAQTSLFLPKTASPTTTRSSSLSDLRLALTDDGIQGCDHRAFQSISTGHSSEHGDPASAPTSGCGTPRKQSKQLQGTDTVATAFPVVNEDAEVCDEMPNEILQFGDANNVCHCTDEFHDVLNEQSVESTTESVGSRKTDFQKSDAILLSESQYSPDGAYTSGSSGLGDIRLRNSGCDESPRRTELFVSPRRDSSGLVSPPSSPSSSTRSLFQRDEDTSISFVTSGLSTRRNSGCSSTMYDFTPKNISGRLRQTDSKASFLSAQSDIFSVRDESLRWQLQRDHGELRRSVFDASTSLQRINRVLVDYSCNYASSYALQNGIIGRSSLASDFSSSLSRRHGSGDASFELGCNGSGSDSTHSKNNVDTDDFYADVRGQEERDYRLYDEILSLNPTSDTEFKSYKIRYEFAGNEPQNSLQHPKRIVENPVQNQSASPMGSVHDGRGENRTTDSTTADTLGDFTGMLRDSDPLLGRVSDHLFISKVGQNWIQKDGFGATKEAGQWDYMLGGDAMSSSSGSTAASAANDWSPVFSFCRDSELYFSPPVRITEETRKALVRVYLGTNPKNRGSTMSNSDTTKANTSRSTCRNAGHLTNTARGKRENLIIGDGSASLFRHAMHSLFQRNWLIKISAEDWEKHKEVFGLKESEIILRPREFSGVDISTFLFNAMVFLLVNFFMWPGSFRLVQDERSKSEGKRVDVQGERIHVEGKRGRVDVQGKRLDTGSDVVASTTTSSTTNTVSSSMVGSPVYPSVPGYSIATISGSPSLPSSPSVSGEDGLFEDDLVLGDDSTNFGGMIMSERRVGRTDPSQQKQQNPGIRATRSFLHQEGSEDGIFNPLMSYSMSGSRSSCVSFKLRPESTTGLDSVGVDSTGRVNTATNYSGTSSSSAWSSTSSSPLRSSNSGFRSSLESPFASSTSNPVCFSPSSTSTKRKHLETQGKSSSSTSSTDKNGFDSMPAYLSLEVYFWLDIPDWTRGMCVDKRTYILLSHSRARVQLFQGYSWRHMYSLVIGERGFLARTAAIYKAIRILFSKEFFEIHNSPLDIDSKNRALRLRWEMLCHKSWLAPLAQALLTRKGNKALDFDCPKSSFDAESQEYWSGKSIIGYILAQGLRFGRLDIAELACRYGAEPKGVFWIVAPFGPISRESMLNIAAISGQVRSVEWLLRKKVDVNQRSEDGMQTALHAAAFSGQNLVLKFLLANGADRHATDAHGFTPRRLVESAMFIRAHWLSKNPNRWNQIAQILSD